MHSSQFGITFTDSRGPVSSDGPIHCIRSLNWMVRYSVMPVCGVELSVRNRASLSFVDSSTLDSMDHCRSCLLIRVLSVPFFDSVGEISAGNVPWYERSIR